MRKRERQIDRQRQTYGKTNLIEEDRDKDRWVVRDYALAHRQIKYRDRNIIDRQKHRKI